VEWHVKRHVKKHPHVTSVKPATSSSAADKPTDKPTDSTNPTNPTSPTDDNDDDDSSPDPTSITPSLAALYNHTSCPRCTLSLALAPYTTYLAPAISLGWSGISIRLFDPHALPPPLIHGFWFQPPLAALARSSWFWWAVRRYGTHNLDIHQASDPERDIVRAWTPQDRIRLVREGWFDTAAVARLVRVWSTAKPSPGFGRDSIDEDGDTQWHDFVNEYEAEQYRAHRAVAPSIHDMLCSLGREKSFWYQSCSEKLPFS
jgi:hypothetical protein